MKKAICLLVLLASQLTIAQQTATDTVQDEDNNIYSNMDVEIKPEYPGGFGAFFMLLSKNFTRPSDSNFRGGRLIVSFLVEKDGSLTEIKVLKDPGFGTAEEAIRVMKLSKKWIPATQNGKPVRCSYQIPINLPPS